VTLQAHWGIGRILLEHRAADQGLPFFQKAVELAKSQRKASKQGSAAARAVEDYSLSVMFLDLGVCYGEVGQISKQIAAFSKSLKLHFRCLLLFPLLRCSHAVLAEPPKLLPISARHYLEEDVRGWPTASLTLRR
jgi:hypothetical protein